MSAHEEAARRYKGDIDIESGERFDDWGYAETQRQAFVAGAEYARGKTVWMKLPTMIWIDPVQRRARTVENQLIEVVTAETGKILVQDIASGTHRVIPVESWLLATMEKNQ